MQGEPDAATGARKEGPPRGTDRWKEETKGIERVIDVAFTLDTAQTAGWIGEQAHVSEQATREHLELFADLGVITATTVSGVTKYRPDPTWLRFKEVSTLVERHSRDELMDHAEAIKERIQEAEERYSVDSPDELRSKAAAADTPIEDIQEYRKVASEWEELKHELNVMEEALKRYKEYDRGRVEA